MVGPGTGHAPFRGFVQERAQLRTNGAVVAPAVLYFGCRQRDVDWIYRDEMEAAAAADSSLSLHVALSREPQQSRQYVQDLMRQHGARLAALILEQGARVYVCGATAMGKAVKDTVIELLAAHGGKSAAAAADHVKKMQTDKKYVAELWES